MSLWRYVRVETLRLLRMRSTWLVCLLTVCLPLLGMGAEASTRAARYLAQPVLLATVLSMALWGLYTVYMLDKLYKSGADKLVDAVSMPLSFSAAKAIALLLAATVAGVLTTLVMWPVTASSMGNVFELGDFLSLYTASVTGGMWIAVLLCASLYQITRRMDLGFILFVAILLVTTSGYFSDNYILRVSNPILPTMSDDYSNAWPLRLLAYNRLVWLTCLGGVYMASLLCIRRYGRGALRSAGYNLRKAYVPAVALVLVAASVAAYAGEPYVNHAPGDMYDHDCEYNENAHLLSTYITSVPDISTGCQWGTATYRVENHNTEPCQQKLYIRCGYGIQSLRINGVETKVTDLDDDLMWGKHFSFELPPEKDLEIVVAYGGMPRLLNGNGYFSFIGAAEVERRFISLGSEALAPILELYPKPGAESSLTADITLPGHMTALAKRGEAEYISDNGDGTKNWRLTSSHDRMSLYAADYVCQRIPLRDQFVEFYYSRKHEEVLARSNIQDVLVETMNYGLDTIGMPGWFADAQTLKLVQDTSYASGGGASAGMSTMYEDSFSEDAMQDPNRGAGSSEVMAHEILHQWWGLGRMMTDMIDPTLEPAWTSEGLTVYSTYRLMKAKHGEAYAREHYVDHWQAQVDAQARDFYNRHPEYLDILPEQYAQGIQASMWMVDIYCEMPLRILKAEGLIGGEAAMDAVLRHLFETEDLEYAPFLSYQDFLNACGLTHEEVAL